LAGKLGAFYRKIIQLGVDDSTPPALIDRVVFSNHLCFIGFFVNAAIVPVNVGKGYHLMTALNGLYFVAIFCGFFFNYRRRYLLGRLLFLGLVYLGMLISGLAQGPVVEIEHFMLPIAVLGFSLFPREERHFSFFFLFLTVGSYLFLANQSGPLLPGFPYAYVPEDRFMNQLSYLTLFVACLMGLSNSFERASKLIDEQRSRLYEERRLAAFGIVVGNVAHEINSPLAALDVQLFHLDSLVKNGRISNEDLLGRLDRVRKISRRLSILVRSLKFISGQDSGDALSPSPIGAVVDSALDLTQDRMEKEGVRFRDGLQLKSQPVACRPVALSQVFLNLLNNALDAVEELPEERRWISLEDSREGDRLRICVTDGGTISPEAQAGLFRNFFTTKPSHRGTGLGLSISRETIEAHGGRLWFDSQSPNTKFVVELPVFQGGA
jgi:signal transduction histidine kinase